MYRRDNILLWLVVLVNTLAINQQQVFELLCFDREQILIGQWWRLLTGHLVHQQWNHFLINLSAIALLIVVFRNISSLSLRLFLLLHPVLVSFYMLAMLPYVELYCGMSALAHGLVVLVVCTLWTHGQRPISLLLLSVFAIKLILEYGLSATLTVETQWPGLPAAHVTGAMVAVIGLMLVASKKMFMNYRKRQTCSRE